MLDTRKINPSHLDLVSKVLQELLGNSTTLRSDQMMIVGAECRNLLHIAAGHSTQLRHTDDIDIGIGLSEWLPFEQTLAPIPSIGSNGIRYRVAGHPVDIVPFGEVEDPPGKARPPAVPEGLNVHGYREVFRGAKPLAIPGVGTVALPTVPGYTALKLFAWTDRSIWYEYRDAVDLATCLYWYNSSPDIRERIWETAHGKEALTWFDLDVDATSAYLLGRDIATLLGPATLKALALAWTKSDKGLLATEMVDRQNHDWQATSERRQVLLNALEFGLWQ
ncbi:hypothetical protein K0651_10285 [Ornithinimicrobium sp. Arc0846-15]|nr:hypothetical protein [Ornithinimicrobium laminariae]